MQADVVADLLERPGVEERGDAVDPGPEAGPRQARAHRDHVLLGHARVDEPPPEGVAQRLEGLETEVAGQEYEIRGDGRRPPGLAKDVSHASVTSDGLMVLGFRQGQVVPLHPVFHE